MNFDDTDEYMEGDLEIRLGRSFYPKYVSICDWCYNNDIDWSCMFGYQTIHFKEQSTKQQFIEYLRGLNIMPIKRLWSLRCTNNKTNDVEVMCVVGEDINNAIDKLGKSHTFIEFVLVEELGKDWQ